MNKSCLILSLLLPCLANSSCEQIKIIKTRDPRIVGVQFGDFRGSIFGENYVLGPLLTMDGDYSSRFTPSLEEIQEAERILASKIDSVVHSRSYLANTPPLISRHLDAYFRQYSGYVNEKNEKLIYFNCLWDKDRKEGPKREATDYKVDFSSAYHVILNGGTYYWQTVVNLNTKHVVEFRVNGNAGF